MRFVTSAVPVDRSVAVGSSGGSAPPSTVLVSVARSVDRATFGAYAHRLTGERLPACGPRQTSRTDAYAISATERQALEAKLAAD
jgi:hypothetical protein